MSLASARVSCTTRRDCAIYSSSCQLTDYRPICKQLLALACTISQHDIFPCCLKSTTSSAIGVLSCKFSASPVSSAVISYCKTRCLAVEPSAAQVFACFHPGCISLKLCHRLLIFDDFSTVPGVALLVVEETVFPSVEVLACCDTLLSRSLPKA